MLPEQPDSTSCRDRAAIYAGLAEQAISAEAAAAMRYLEQMWLVIAEVTEVIEKNRSRLPLGSDPRRLSPQ
jgi:hypothetical protein